MATEQTAEQASAAERKRREDQNKAAEEEIRRRREETQKNNEETQRAQDESQPTPTQDELDRMKMGIHADDKDDDEEVNKPRRGRPPNASRNVSGEEASTYQTR